MFATEYETNGALFVTEYEADGVSDWRLRPHEPVVRLVRVLSGAVEEATSNPRRCNQQVTVCSHTIIIIHVKQRLV